MITEKIRFLDGLRGTATIMVVLLHYFAAFYYALYSGNVNDIRTTSGIEMLISRTPLNLIYAGDFAVCIFFVLSGYILTYRYFKFKNQEVLISGAIRRYFRLVIPVFFSLIIAYLFMKFSLFYNTQAGVIASPTYLTKFWTFIPNLSSMIEQALFGILLDGRSSYNVVLWTMTIEFFGSMLVFGMSSLFGNSKNRYIMYIVAIILSINTYYPAFVLGMMLSDLYNRESQNILTKINKPTIFFIFIIGLFLGSYPTIIDVNNTIYGFMKIKSIINHSISYHIFGAFLVMIAVLSSKKLKALFSSNILYFVGKISFSIYVIHFIILCSFSSYLFLNIIPYLKYYQAFSITFIISMIIIILLSSLIHKYIDMNGIKLSKYIYYKYFSGKDITSKNIAKEFNN